MKKLNKLQINSVRYLNNDELLALKGGEDIDKGWLTCRVDGIICWSNPILSCDYAVEACDNVCGSWTELVCAGW